MRKSYLLLHFAVLLAGFTGVFGKLISLNEGLLTLYRLLFSVIFLFFIVKLFRIADQITGKERFNMAKIGMILTIHWVFFYASIKYANISIGVVCYCLTSLFTAIFHPLINKTRFRLSEILLSLMTLLGISLIFHFDTTYQLGIVLGIISSAFAALYTIYNEQLAKKYDGRIISYYQMIGGTVGWSVLLPAYLYLFPTDYLIPDWKDTVYLLLMSLFCTVGLYLIFIEVLRKIPAFTANLTFNLEPVYAIILAFLFFDESKEVSISFYFGLLFVMASVALQAIFSIRKKKKLKLKVSP